MTDQNPQHYMKDPDATKIYGIEWERWLTTGETIVTSMWLLPADSGLIQSGATISGTITSVKLAGGTVSASEYTIVNRITTSLGQIEDAEIYLLVRDNT
jgi:hypothetical protein